MFVIQNALFMPNKASVAIVISHPIQHFCPQYSSYAKYQSFSIKVFFASTLGLIAFEDKDFKQKIRWGNIQVEEFDHVFLNGRTSLPISPKLDALSLEEELTNYNPDVVLVSGYFQKFQRRAYNWARKNKKLIFYISDAERIQKRPFWKEALKFIFLRNYFKSINRFLTVGNSNEHYYQFYGVHIEKMTRVGFSIDVALYKNAFEEYKHHRTSVRNKLGIEKNIIVLSVVGKLIKHKRQLDLIKSLILLEQLTSQEFHLLVIGSGEQKNVLEAFALKLCKNKVHFIGFVAPEQLPPFYAATDIYIHPSEVEPHSLAISEAIFMGCPVITSNRCGSYGPTDDVQIGRNGYIYPASDINALALKIKHLGERKDLRNQFCENSRKFAITSQASAHGLGLEMALLAEGLI